MKNSIKIICLLFFVNCSLFSQEKKEKQFNTKKWYRSVGIGNSIYRYMNFPKGRNEINCASEGRNVNQSKGYGYVLDAMIQYRINKNYVGININYYSDVRNSSGIQDQTVDEIKNNGLTSLTIHDNQSYLNLGLNYERQLYILLKGRISLDAAFGAGYSINLTPDRTEYDYFYQDFLTPEGDTSSVFRHVSTDFKNSFYINPELKIRVNSSTNHGMIFSLSALYQRHEAFKNCVEKKRIYGQSFVTPPSVKYNVLGIQLKFNYFF